MSACYRHRFRKALFLSLFLVIILGYFRTGNSGSFWLFFIGNNIKRWQMKPADALKNIYRDFYVGASYYKTTIPFRMKNLRTFAIKAGEKDATVLANYAKIGN